jgi:signal transduction histidine kinase
MQTLEQGGYCVAVLDREGRVDWMSPSTLTLFGLNPLMRPPYPFWRDLIAIDGVSVWDDSLQREYEIQGFLKTEGFCDVPNKGRVALELTMRREPGSDQCFVLLRDVTSEHLSRVELEHEKHNAEQLNQALEREIHKANTLAVMAERANVAKSVFLTSMSHEFRTPLNGVLGYAQILSQDGSLEERQRKAAMTIEKSGRHLLSLINDVLDLSKIEAGKVAVSKQSMNLLTLLQDVIDVIKVRAHSKGLELSLSIADSLDQVEWISGDAKVIRQVLINLIGNAIKFTDVGKVTLAVSQAPAMERTPDSMLLRFEVRDTGPGIAPQERDHIFEEFYQTEAFSGHKGGTGLGLTISRRLVDAMGGQLRVDSELGKGSCFWFEIPCTWIREGGVRAESHVLHSLTSCSVKNGCFLQCFPDEKDSGLLRSVMEGIGFSGFVVSDELATAPACMGASVGLLVIGVPSGSLRMRYEQWFPEWTPGRIADEVVWLVYLDGSGNDCRAVRGILESTRSICLEAPVDVNTLVQTLRDLSPGHWKELQSEQKTVTVEKAQEMGTEVPETALLRRLIRDAQIGDIRSLNEHLSAWETGLGHETGFGRQVRVLLDGFQIDQLCSLLSNMEGNRNKKE